MASGQRTQALLADALARIQREIDSKFDALLPMPADPRSRLVEAMRYAAIGGGKRLRPLLVTATADMFRVDRDAAVRAGAAVEAIHVYSLIHDDLPCMDNDDMRHGKPTLHRQFDEATAVLAGDALHDLAFEILADSATSGDPFTRIELVGALATASGAQGMAGGQMMDMVAEGESFDLPTVTRLQQLKTGALLGASVEMAQFSARSRRKAAPTCAAMPATSASPFRSPMTCSIMKATKRRPAKRCARMRWQARKPLFRCWAPNVPAPRPVRWSNRRSPISPSMARKPTCCAMWRAT